MNRMYNLSIAIADILIEVQSPLSAADLGIESRLGSFFGILEHPIAKVSLIWEDCQQIPVSFGELIYNPDTILQMYRSKTKFNAVISYPSGVAGVLRANARWDDLLLIESRGRANWRSLLNTIAGELLMRVKLILTNGLVFHASGIDDNGQGIVFVGHSGSGKSTQLGLWNRMPGIIAINDDRIAIRVNEYGAICYGMPWSSETKFARNHQAKLSALILLEHASENDLHILSPSTAAPLLLSCAFLPYWDRSLMQRAMANLNALLERVPVFLLRCRPEPAVVSLVRSVL